MLPAVVPLTPVHIATIAFVAPLTQARSGASVVYAARAVIETVVGADVGLAVQTYESFWTTVGSW